MATWKISAQFRIRSSWHISRLLFSFSLSSQTSAAARRREFVHGSHELHQPTGGDELARKLDVLGEWSRFCNTADSHRDMLVNPIQKIQTILLIFRSRNNWFRLLISFNVSYFRKFSADPAKLNARHVNFPIDTHQDANRSTHRSDWSHSTAMASDSTPIHSGFQAAASVCWHSTED